MGLEIFEFSPYPVDLIHMVPRYPDLIGFTGEDIVKALNQHIWFPFLARGPKLTLHAKTYVVDGKITQIGSHNFDPRSAVLNSECGLIIYDEAFAQQVREDILRDTAQGNSWVVAKRIEKDNPVTYISGVIESLSNMLPIFDIWPYHYTSNYQLKPGYAPLPSSRHPDFYEHYEDIGQFPLIRKTFGAVRARLVKVFGGWTGSFM
jgi:cardiolipin synthase C